MEINDANKRITRAKWRHLSLLFFSPTKMIYFSIAIILLPFVTALWFIHFSGQLYNLPLTIIYIAVIGILWKIPTREKDIDVVNSINPEIIKVMPFVFHLILCLSFSCIILPQSKQIDLLWTFIFIFLSAIYYILGLYSNTQYERVSRIFFLVAVIAAVYEKHIHPFSVLIYPAIIGSAHIFLALSMRKKGAVK